MKNLKIIPFEKNSEDFFNIEPASSFIPDWYRKSDSRMKDTSTELLTHNPITTTSTYKKCTPFFDAMTSGYMCFLTADIEIARKEDGMPYIMWRTQRTIISEHSNEQWDGLPAPDGYSPYVYKWHNQFFFDISDGYSLLFLSPLNRFDLPFISISGIVDVDNYHLPIYFPFFIKDNFSGIIKKGTPIVQIIPIKRESWQRSYGTFDQNISDKNSEKYFSNIKRSYKNWYWERKEYK